MTVLEQAVAAMVSIGFDESRALHVLQENAAQLRRIKPSMTEEDALDREARATLIRFGE